MNSSNTSRLPPLTAQQSAVGGATAGRPAARTPDAMVAHVNTTLRNEGSTANNKLLNRLYSSTASGDASTPNMLMTGMGDKEHKSPARGTGPSATSTLSMTTDQRASTQPAGGAAKQQQQSTALVVGSARGQLGGTQPGRGRDAVTQAAGVNGGGYGQRRSEVREMLVSDTHAKKRVLHSRGQQETRPDTAVRCVSAVPSDSPGKVAESTWMSLPSGEQLEDDDSVAGDEDSPVSTGTSQSPFSFIRRVLRGDPMGKFIYLMIRATAIKQSYNPYDLVVVEHKDTDPNNYFTRAKEGVTHVQNGEADFLPLSSWMREHDVFSKILSIPFFGRYKRWKTFYTWRNHVRRTRVSLYKDYLEENLFILNPDLSPPQLEVRRICQDLQEMDLYAPVSETKTLDAFGELQAVNREVQARTLDEKISAIREIIDGACKAAMNRSIATTQGQTAGSDLANTAPAAGTGAAAASTVAKYKSGRGGKASASLVPGGSADDGSNGPQRQTYIELSQKRAVCRRLTSFIRLCDYMVVDALVKLAMKSVEEIKCSVLFPKPVEHQEEQEEEEEEVDPAAAEGKTAHQLALEAAGVAPGSHNQNDDGPFKGSVFFIDLVFVDDSVVIQPNLESFIFKAESVVKKFTETIVRVERFVQMEAFAAYTKHAASDHPGDSELGVGPDVNDMVTGEEHYKSLVHTIKMSLQTAFADIENYALNYEKFKTMYLQNRMLDSHKIKEEAPPLDWFREERQRYHTQQHDIENIPPAREVAIFTVKTDNFKTVMTPSPVRCLDEIEALLPLIAKERNDALMRELSEANHKLESETHTVEEFVDFVKFHSDIVLRMPQINQEYDSISEMYLLIMTELEIKNPSTHDEHLKFSEGTGPAMSKLRGIINQVEESKDGLTRHFVDNIDQQMEGLRTTMHEVQEKGKNPIIDDEDANLEEVIDFVQELASEMDKVKNREKQLGLFLELIDPTRVGEAGNGLEDELLEIHRVIGDKVKLWTSLRDWQAKTAEWNETVFDNLDQATIEIEVQKYDKAVRQVDRTLKGNPVVPKLRGMVDEFRLTLPVIGCLKNANLKDHHWSLIDEIVGRPLSQDPNYTLGVLMDIRVMDLKDEIQQVSNQATQEQQLDEMLQTVQKRWQGIEFIVNGHKDQKDTYVLGSVEDILTHLEESSVVVSTIASNRFCAGGLRRRVDQWEHDMKYMSETLDKWLEVQRKWMYLENIFSQKELQAQWPDDARSFLTVDKGFRELMKRTYTNPGVRNSLTQNNYSLLAIHKKDIDTLERIEKRLEEKLDQKRRLFPRFYFLSNDDLLDILANIKHPERIAPHMLGMFEGVKKLSFSDSYDVTHMHSQEGEVVPMAKTFKARGQVEKWLGDTELNMLATVRRMAKVCWEDFNERPRMEWIFQHPVQLVLCVSQIYWSKGSETALQDGKMKDYYETNMVMLKDLAAATAQDLNKVARAMLRTLITLDVHGRDLIAEMVRENVARAEDFGWTKQLRCYWEVLDTDTSGHGDIVLKQNNSFFVYGYEYLGAQGRLVITPLTDRVFMTVTGALHLCLGTAPSGPAGTGKTESVKDLAKGLGRQCIVFNCSDGVTYKMMENFFSGLCQTGAWCCLDEFNRIGIEVLSVIASQLHEVRQALLTQKNDPSFKVFTFQGQPDIDLKPTFGCCITMNPGYAGRTELPDNLKALFRPISVMTPDFRMIAEVILYSEGFSNATNLSLKITQLYKLSSEQLSAQHHYDFGMRALKSILVMAGDLKRSQPDVHEDLTLIIACNDSNIPKFVADDIPLFKGIMGDLFPGVEIPVREYDELLPAIERCMAANAQEMVPTYVNKILQLFETMIVRHGVMTVGETGAGKSNSKNTLATALTEMCEMGSKNKQAKIVHQHIMNPKSIAMSELYGSIDVNTNEWQDGILPIVVKQCRSLNDSGAEGYLDHQWIVFDGPVDTLWVESLNSVLDDSKLLCLDNGVRIRLPDTIHMVFEVSDLAVASPATVSRCGMVYMDFVEIGWEPTVYKWLRTKMKDFFGPQTQEYVHELFVKKLTGGHKWLATVGKQLIKGAKQNMTQSCVDLFHALCVTNKVSFPADQGEEEDKEVTVQRKEIIHAIFAFCYIWTFGGNVDDVSREKFDQFAREQLEDIINFSGPSAVFDFMVDFENRKLMLWETQVPDFVYNPSVPYFDILVPTIDTFRYSYLLETLIRCRKPVLYSGQSGTGKSVIVQQTLANNVETMSLVNVIVQFSAKTNAERTQEMIESKLKVKKKNLLGAPLSGTGEPRTVALFIDDLNMPALETFGASPPVELIRQMIGNGGFYDRKALFWKNVQDVVCLAAAGPPEGGRSVVTPRLVRFFHLLQIPNLSEESMVKIFQSIMNGFFGAASFPGEVKELVKPMVEGSIDLYNEIRVVLRPRPAKAHYTFNLRDLSKVFQGIMQVIPKTCNNAQSGIRLWVHENQRNYFDRLVNDEDRLYFTETMMDVINRKFGSNASKFSHASLFEGQPVIWGDFLKVGVPVEDRVYEECLDMRKLPRVLEEYNDDYNLSTSKVMNLVFFDDHCYHLSRIARIIRQPRGNALLVGVGGSGKQSLTRLAASMNEYQVFQIEVNSKYSLDKFHEDLLQLYQIAGIDRRPVVFLFTDTQIVDEGMVEDINNMLNSGEVPSLFTVEEKDKKINQSMEAAREAGCTGSRDDVYSFFISRVRDNLHIVLGMSPVGDAFRTRCRNFPSLTNCCSVDWFDEWPTDALRQVATRQFSSESTDFDFEVFGKGLDLPAKLTELCVKVHRGVSRMAERFFDELRRHYYITPTSYLEFIALYTVLLEDKYREVGDQLGKLEGGSQKMEETNDFIAKKKVEIVEQQPILEESTRKNDELLKVLKVRQEKANAVRVTVSAQETEATEQQKVAAALEADAKADLAVAMPQLEAAEKALQSLDKSAINEIKSYAKPPKAVEMTMEAVMIMLEEGKYDWKRAKDLLGRADFLPLLLKFDRDNVSRKTIDKVSKFTNDDDFTPEAVKKGGSSATATLCVWCHAIYKYYFVAQEIEPKRKALAKAQNELETTNKKLAEAQSSLKAVEDELAELEAGYTKSVTEKKELEDSIERAKRQLVNAEILTESLGSETASWTLQIKELRGDVQKLPGDVFLAGASIIYFGAFTPLFRQRIVAEWLESAEEEGVPVSQKYGLVRTMADPMQVREWQIDSLPTDNTSAENAVLCLASCESAKLSRWPLMIDPQGQAGKWIRASQARKGLKVLKMADPKYMTKLAQAITNGTPILIDDIGETLDPALESVLLKQVYSVDGQAMINLGGADHPTKYDHLFRLYLTTKLANPHYLPEVCIKVTLINFTVTMEGLEDQMLGEVVAIEKAELEEQKAKEIKRVAEGKKRKKTLEKQILEKLESASGNVLDEPEIISALKNSQQTGSMLIKQLAEAEEKERIINEAREEYRGVAKRCAILYFVMADLPLIDPMYQYSLDYFKRLVKLVVEGAEGHPTVPEHLAFLTEAVTEATYRAVCRGVFNRHKIVYSLMMCSSIARGSGSISGLEWSFFNRPGSFMKSDREAKPATLPWLKDMAWGYVDALVRSGLPAFESLLTDMKANPDAWKDWYQSEEPQNQALPGAWEDTVSIFQRCILVRTLREEKTFMQLLKLVDSELGPKYVEAPAFDLNVAFDDSAFDRPIIFILSQGSDPTDGFLKWARDSGRQPRYISLGQGQEGPARRLIESGKKNGDWILLQNCHLGKSFMGELQEIVANLDPTDKASKETFRMWITSMPVDYFPIPILQNSIKITNEAPSGLKANMTRCFNDIQESELCYFDDQGKWSALQTGHVRSGAYKKLLFGMTFFHSIILERRKFGPLGWNTKYEWNDTDLSVSREWLRLFLEQETVPWESMTYIIGEINYGGRVTDPLDRLCLASILRNYFCPGILEDTYALSESGVYRAPAEGNLQFYKQRIDDLPRIDEPEVFGMHPNASLTYQLRESNDVLGTLLAIQPRASGSSGSGPTPEEQVKQKAQEFLDSLPEELDIETEAGPTSLIVMDNGVPNSLSTVLRHEVDKFNKLLRQQRMTLLELQKAIAGLTVLSEALDKMYLDFLNNIVPQLWMKASYLSLKPLGAWYADMLNRVDFCREWLRKGEPPSFWLSGLFSPHGFMTGVLQGHARKHVISVDLLGVSFQVMPFDTTEEPPESGVYVHGLFADSFRWDRENMHIIDSLPAESYASLPVVLLLPEEQHVCPSTCYPCPTYITTSRHGVLSSLGASTNFIMCIEVPKEEANDYWIRKGAAIVCQLIH